VQEITIMLGSSIITCTTTSHEIYIQTDVFYIKQLRHNHVVLHFTQQQ